MFPAKKKEVPVKPWHRKSMKQHRNSYISNWHGTQPLRFVRCLFTSQRWVKPCEAHCRSLVRWAGFGRRGPRGIWSEALSMTTSCFAGGLKVFYGVFSAKHEDFMGFLAIALGLICWHRLHRLLVAPSLVLVMMPWLLVSWRNMPRWKVLKFLDPYLPLQMVIVLLSLLIVLLVVYICPIICFALDNLLLGGIFVLAD